MEALAALLINWEKGVCGVKKDDREDTENDFTSTFQDNPEATGETVELPIPRSCIRLVPLPS